MRKIRRILVAVKDANARVALRDAFSAAKRKLQDYERLRRGDTKTPRNHDVTVRPEA